MGRGGTVLGIIGIILAAASFGFTFIVLNGQDTTKVVGIWDEIDENLDYPPYNLQDNWLLEFGGNNLSITDYISISNANTRIALLKSGWYRIHLSVLLTGIDPTYYYWIIILKDGAAVIYLDVLYPGVVDSSTVRMIDSSSFVYSDGTNYIEIYGTSNDDFWPSLNRNNQLTIEYVAT